MPARVRVERAAAAISAICAALRPDIICLGEVSADVGAAIWRSALPSRYQYEPLDKVGPRLHFRMALLWNEEIIEAATFEAEIDVIAGRDYKTCARAKLRHRHGMTLTAFLVHWRSRLMAGEDSRIRGDLAQKLRAKVERNFSVDPDDHVLVLGDFNDNPYDLSLTRYLRATRDINLARHNAELLYNPFWRPLISKSSYRRGDPSEASSGSYFHNRSNETHQWHVFDQVLISHGLLGFSNWHLNEAETGVLDRAELHGISLEPKSSFDHYPVIALFEKDERT